VEYLTAAEILLAGQAGYWVALPVDLAIFLVA
jgi:hypothetical protein